MSNYILIPKIKLRGGDRAVYFIRKKILVFTALSIMLTCSTLFSGVSAAASYTVKKGDSLWSIASRHKISVDKLQQFNNIGGSLIYPGQMLKVNEDGKPAPQPDLNPAPASNPEPAPHSSDSTNNKTYIVKSGDTLWAIARQHNTTVEGLQRLNDINGQLLKPGQVLKIDGQALQSLASRGGNSREIVTTALRFLGTPYVSGGKSPAGFDCSGFVKYVYSLNGITLPNIAANQANAGTKMRSILQLQPGDIVCFSNGRNGHIDHVGIYAGNNKIIHASTSRRSIIEASLNDSWFKQRFVCGVRVL